MMAHIVRRNRMAVLPDEQFRIMWICIPIKFCILLFLFQYAFKKSFQFLCKMKYPIAVWCFCPVLRILCFDFISSIMLSSESHPLSSTNIFASGNPPVWNGHGSVSLPTGYACVHQIHLSCIQNKGTFRTANHLLLKQSLLQAVFCSHAHKPTSHNPWEAPCSLHVYCAAQNPVHTSFPEFFLIIVCDFCHKGKNPVFWCRTASRDWIRSTPINLFINSTFFLFPYCLLN